MLPITIIVSLLAGAPAVAPEGPRQMAITFDDLPGVAARPTLGALTRVNRQVLAASGDAGTRPLPSSGARKDVTPSGPTARPSPA